MTLPDDSAAVIAIHLGSEAEGPLESAAEVRAVAGRGLEGDRYFLKAGTFTKQVPGPDSELTLIESEQIEEFVAATGIAITSAQLRRNIVTAGINLNELVDKEFHVGGVPVRGIRLCEPCQHLADLTCHDVLQRMVHRAGLRAQILADGVIRVGDRIVVQ